MKWTEEEYQDHLRKQAAGRAEKAAGAIQAMAAPKTAQKPMYALGRLPAGTMNKTEAAYAAHLELRRQAGEIQWFKFEAIKLRLADNTFFTVDFFVLNSDGYLEAHETKGFMMEDAVIKLKVAAASFPFRFFLIRKKPAKDGGGWSIKSYSR